MSRKLAVAIALTLLAVIAVPFALHALARQQHVSHYTGICGPHAPDIKAHPCTRDEYLAEFNAGFEGVGLLLVELAALMVSGTVAAMAWLAWVVLRRRSQPTSDGRG